MPEPRPLRPADPREVGGFRLTARIGEGAQGSVFLGTSESGERVAVKLLHADIGRDGRARTLFERELAAARRVAPFCTARILSAEADTETPYIASEYIDGPSLRERIVHHGVAAGDELMRLAIGTATALAAIHEAGVVHRDFKPANVLLGPDGPKVIDFGIARPLDTTSATMTGAVGTPAYMAPEQFAGVAGGAPLDMFAWGCTMAFTANGVPPFGASSAPAIMNRVLHGQPDLGALPGELRAVVASCLAKDPAERPPAVQVLRRLLGTQTDTDGSLLAEGTSAAATLPSVPLPPPQSAPAAPFAPPSVPPPSSGMTMPGAPPQATFGYPVTQPRPQKRRTRTLVIVGATGVGLVVAVATLTGTLLWDLKRQSRDIDKKRAAQNSSSPVAGSTQGPCTYKTSGVAAKDVGKPPAQPPSSLPTQGTIKTNRGTLEVRLDATKAPCAVNSLSFLANKRYYDNSPCHRITTVQSLKILQCGDPTGAGTGGPGYQFGNENSGVHHYPRGTIAMANTGTPDSNGSQFFIAYSDFDLPGSYTRVGQVTSGMEVVDKIAKAGAEPTNGEGDGKPKQSITITEFQLPAT